MSENVHRKLHKPMEPGVRKISAPVHRTTSETIRINTGAIGGGSIGSSVNETSSSSSSSSSSSEKSQLALGQLGQNSTSQTSPLTNSSNSSSSSSSATNNNNCNSTTNNNNTSTNNNNNTLNQCRKKTSSFQITSVTVGGRMSNDAGEDSNDDLDESHGEDNSIDHSRIEHTDIETPSYSEDTFSKEDVFFNASNTSIGAAPVIPTSSQYGLAIVSSENLNNPNNTNNDNNINTLDITSVTDNNIINLLSSNVNNKQDNDLSLRDGVHGHGRNERFKVVKIESTEPFKRGRWTCMDYLDHTSVNNQSNVITTTKVSDPNEVCISYGVTDIGIVPIIDNNKTSSSINDDSNKGINIDINGHGTHQDICHSNSPIIANNSSTPTNNSNVVTTSSGAGYNVSQQQQQQQQRNQQQPGGQQQQQIPQYYQPCSHPSSQQTGQQAATLPSNLQSPLPNNLGQPQSMPQGSIPIITTSPQTNNNPQKEDYVTIASQNQQQQQQQQFQGQNVCQATSGASTNIIVPQSASQQQPSTTGQQQQTINQINDNNIQQGIQTIHQTASSSPGQVPPTNSNTSGNSDSGNQVNQVTSSGQQAQSQNVISTNGLNGGSGGAAGGVGGGGGNSNTTAGGGGGGTGGNSSGNGGTGAGTGAINRTNNNSNDNNFGVRFTQANYPSGILGRIGFQQSYAEQDSASGFAADAALLECLAEVTQAADDPKILENNESMSGTGAVAIDNKIEQAMDLVKSHLMYAVREEVQVLKQKITELTDHISILEAENALLKTHASPETLAQLNQSTTKSTQNNTANGGQ